MLRSMEDAGNDGDEGRHVWRIGRIFELPPSGEVAVEGGSGKMKLIMNAGKIRIWEMIGSDWVTKRKIKLDGRIERSQRRGKGVGG